MKRNSGLHDMQSPLGISFTVFLLLRSWSSQTGWTQALTLRHRLGVFSSSAVTPHHGHRWNPLFHIPGD